MNALSRIAYEESLLKNIFIYLDTLHVVTYATTYGRAQPSQAAQYVMLHRHDVLLKLNTKTFKYVFDDTGLVPIKSMELFDARRRASHLRINFS